MFIRHRHRARLRATYLEMPNRLHRYYGAGYLHFITTSCYQRRALLGTRQHRDLFLHVLERVRRRYRFVVAGYVVMPEHVHLRIGEPERGNPSAVMQALKQGFARRLLCGLRSAVDPRQGRLAGAQLSNRRTSGNAVSTTSWFLPSGSGWKNYATCMAIR